MGRRGDRSAGMGGTATVIPKQAKQVDLAKDFLKFAKASKEGNIKLWTVLGFDPLRWDVWDSDELKNQINIQNTFKTDNTSFPCFLT